MRIEGFVLLCAQPAEHVREIAAFLAGNAKRASGPWIDAHLRHVGDAALGAGGNEARIGAHHALDDEELLELDHRPLAIEDLPGEHLTGGEIDGHHGDADLACTGDVDARAAPDMGTSFESADLFLARLQQLDGFEPDRVLVGWMAAHDVSYATYLIGRERLERVLDLVGLG